MKPSWEMTGLAMDSMRGAPTAGPADAAALNILSDEALMQRIGRGDEPAYAALVGRHLSRNLGFATRLLGDRAEGEGEAIHAFAHPKYQSASLSPLCCFQSCSSTFCFDTPVALP